MKLAPSDMMDYWDKRAASYTDVIKKNLEGEWESVWSGELTRHFPKGCNLSVLDIGTGPGFYSIILAKQGFKAKGVGMPWRFWPQKKLKEAGCINIESDYQNLVLNVSFLGHRAKAYICKDCRTGIFEYDEEPEKPSLWDI